MILPIATPSNLRMLLPETLWLEPEHYAQAQQASDRQTDERSQWQTYLQTLATLSFQEWLQEKLSDDRVALINGYLSTNGFTLCIVANEHVLDERVKLPRQVVDSPADCAHYYVFIEVLEEEQEAIIRGFLRYDEFTDNLNQLAAVQTLSTSDEYSLPLAHLDSEPNHLVSYIQQLSPSAIPLPAAAATSRAISIAAQQAVALSTDLATRLGQWLEGSLSEGWQALDALVNPNMSLALATRSNPTEVKAGKLVNLGVHLEERSVVLLMTVVPDENEKINVNVQVLPSGDTQVLPPQLKTALISSKGKVLQEVTTREQDNFIQLRSFKGKAGIRFSIEITLNDVQVKEDFEL